MTEQGEPLTERGSVTSCVRCEGCSDRWV